jgi:hypothetical protein
MMLLPPSPQLLLLLMLIGGGAIGVGGSSGGGGCRCEHVALIDCLELEGAVEGNRATSVRRVVMYGRGQKGDISALRQGVVSIGGEHMAPRCAREMHVMPPCPCLALALSFCNFS